MPVDLPQGVSATIGAEAVTLKGAKGSLTLPLKNGIKVVQQDKHLEVAGGCGGRGHECRRRRDARASRQHGARA